MSDQPPGPPTSPDPTPDPAAPHAATDATPLWDVVAAGRRNRDHLGLRLACLELGLTALVVEPGLRNEIRGRRARVTHADTAREDVVAAMARARCVAVALRDPDDPSGLEEVADAVALGRPLVVPRSVALPEDLVARGAGIVVEDDTAQAWADALATVLADPGAWSAARLGEWRSPYAAPAVAGRRAREGRVGRSRRGALAAAGVAAAILPPLLGGR